LQSGFSLLELLIVMALVGVVLLIGIPNLLQVVRQSRTIGFMNEVQNQLGRARQEAIRRGVPVVVQQDTDRQRIFSFANVDGDADLEFNEDNTVPYRTADYEVGSLFLPSAGSSQFLYFHGPGDADPEGPDMADGLSTDGDGDLVAVFESDGSIRSVGGFRFGDNAKRNFFEIRISPAATARVEVRKWYVDPPFGSGTSGFFPRGFDETTNKNLWKWY
jgi:prepilin-type N-terminal cleavage/methylation domain-containing protein